MPFYPTPVRSGTYNVASLGDGYTISVSWHQAFPTVLTNKIAYNIYYSTVKKSVFAEGAKYVSIDNSLVANIIDLIPGQEYFFCVRPIEYNLVDHDLTNLPIAYDNLRVYPQSLLRANISNSNLIIPLLDISDFPLSGVVRIGAEAVQYSSIDSINNNLIVPSGSAGTAGQLINQGGSNYFTPFIGNTGAGTISSLTAVPASGALTENWNILCNFVQRNNLNAPITGTAKFIAIGSISGLILDGYANPIVWTANGTIVSNGIISFAINDGSPVFVEGDGFLVKMQGAGIGVPNGRGYNNSVARSHTIAGFDGYFLYNPIVSLYIPGDDSSWDQIFACQNRFEYPNYQYTATDGYHQVVKDLLHMDLSEADASNVNFPMYDFSGYHRTDPVQLLNGTCVGSYIGGEMGCIDKYGNVQILRGFSLQDQNTQRQDVLLSITGRDAILIKMVHTGITCSCYLPSSEYQDDRCPKCYGTKFVFGYEQYFNQRSSNGRIRVRPGPTVENIKQTEAGLESEFPVDLWTLSVPTIHTRDIIVLFDQDGVNEEFRYEVSDVTRNNTIVGLQGGQHMKALRIRKFDPAYQIRIFRDSSSFPSKLNTSISFVPGIPPHVHTIIISEKITSIYQINQTTNVVQGHSHPVINGEIIESIGHSHTIIL